MRHNIRRRYLSGTYLTSCIVGGALGLAIWKGTELLVLGIIHVVDNLLGK